LRYEESIQNFDLEETAWGNWAYIRRLY